MAGSFFDSNVLLYLVSSDTAKADRAEDLLRQGGTISVQVLNEIANVARRRFGMSWAETHTLLDSLRRLLLVCPLTTEIHESGLSLAARHQLSIYDSMIVAAALGAGCDTLWSEDMEDGFITEGRLRIANPFKAMT